MDELGIRIVAFVKKAIADVNRFRISLLGVGSSVKKLDKSMDAYQKHVTKVSQSQRNATDVTEKIARTNRRLVSVNNRLSKSTKQATVQAGQFFNRMEKGIPTTRQLNNLWQAHANVQKKVAKRNLDLSESLKKHGIATNTMVGVQKNYTQKLIDSIPVMSKTEHRVRSLGSGAKNVAAMWKKMGLSFLVLIGPLFLVGAAFRTVQQAVDWALQPFIKFEDAMFDLRKTANLTKKQMDDIGSSISLLSLRIPIAADSLANMAATAGRLGIRGKDIIKFTETVAQMSVATNLTAEDAAQALGKIAAAFSIPIENIDKIASAINELSNTTASTARDIVESMENVGAAGKLLGITEDQVAAMSATLIDMGMDASRSGTRIRRLLTELARKSETIEKDISGTFANWGETLREDPMEALMQYLKYLSEIEDPIERAILAHKHFGKVGGFAVNSLAQNYKKLEKNMKTAHNEMIYGGSLVEEYAIAINKTSSEMQRLANETDVVKRQMGEDLAPVLISAKELWNDLLWAISGTTYAQVIGKQTTEGYVSVISDLDNQFQSIGKSVAPLPKVLEAVAKGQTQFELTKPEFWGRPSQIWKDVGAEVNAYTNMMELVPTMHDRAYKSASKVIGVYDELKISYKDITEGETQVEDATTNLGKATQWLNYLEENDAENLEGIAKARQTVFYQTDKLRESEENLANTVYKHADADVRDNEITGEHAETLKSFTRVVDKANERSEEYNLTQEAAIFLANKESQEYIRLQQFIGNTWTKETNKTQQEYVDGILDGVDTLPELIALSKDFNFEVKEVGGTFHITAKTFGEDMPTITKNLEKLKSTKDWYDDLTFAMTAVEDATRKLTEASNGLIGSAIGIGSAYGGAFSAMDSMLDKEEELTIASGGITDSYESMRNEIKNIDEEMKNLPKNSELLSTLEERRAALMAAVSLKVIDTYSDEKVELLELLDLMGKTTDPEQIAKYAESGGDIIKGMYEDWRTYSKENTDATGRDISEGTKKWLDDLTSYVESEGITIPASVEEYKGGKTFIDALLDPKTGLPALHQNVSDIEADIKRIFGVENAQAWANVVMTTLTNADTITSSTQTLHIEVDKQGFVDSFTAAMGEVGDKTYSIDIKPIFVDVLPSIKESIIGALPGTPPPEEHQFGGDIYKTGLYKLHRGETVLTKEQTTRNTKQTKEFKFDFSFGNIPQGITRGNIEDMIRTSVYNAVKEVY